ncbi:MAG: carbamoyl-phosphate synthase large subunit [bacterium TMED88]|nr:carbamoyl-phosphate synthase large subunit [Deltaproteobacteria bacterium]OUV27171.1 MAG: carbamoyl-phosphate synthase large subunit [bacterium TMED88]
MSFSKLLIANRGEVAIRIARAAAALGIESHAVYSEDDSLSLHVRRADRAHPLTGRGALAYLDIKGLIAAAQETGCEALHPGYGFLSESGPLARACEAAGLNFVGPSPDTLEKLGDKAEARALARACNVPILNGTPRVETLEDARSFFESLGGGSSLLIKAVAGGGGRGMRVVERIDDLEAALERCRSEAEKAFGVGDVYLEQRVAQARHVEVQLIGDGESVSHIWERECTLQRRHQKLVEVAPSPDLSEDMRHQLFEASIRMAQTLGYRGLGTFEFLLNAEDPERFYFIEANARLQVEHTVTEAVTGIDLVQAQLAIAGGARLADLGLEQSDISPPVGYAVQCRINTEKMAKDGSPRPAGGTFSHYELASGPGLRADAYGYAGYTPQPAFDSLTAKLIAHSPASEYVRALDLARRALRETRIEGVATNIPFLVDLLNDPDVRAHRITTGSLEKFARDRAASDAEPAEPLYFTDPPAQITPSPAPARAQTTPALSNDPLAILEYGHQKSETNGSPTSRSPGTSPQPSSQSIKPEASADGAIVQAPVQGIVVTIDVEVGSPVWAGQPMLVIEAMKMEHVVTAPISGQVIDVGVSVGEAIFEHHPLCQLIARSVEAGGDSGGAETDLDRIRPDLAEVIERHRLLLDESRPNAVARRRKTGQRTARENIADLCDPGTFIEYGGLTVAAQRRRRELDDLIRNTPTDGMVTGAGSVNGALFPDQDSRCLILSYDYTVLAGTQGKMNHAKKDRMFALAEQWRLPVVIFTEGGGGRPGDTDATGVAGLDCWAFHYFGRLSGLVPLVGINSGRCFAGNAALLGCCDVVIATRNSNIGMGGPAMIEGGGLGLFRPEEVGPIEDQEPNGVVDLVVENEAEAVATAQKYLSYFQGPLTEWSCGDPRKLRHVIPENRLRIYDVRQVIEGLADEDSVLELRRSFGLGMVTALIRIEGRPIGVVANNPAHLAGAIDRDGADKAARFMQLCDAFDLPICFLCDTPGIMVGPDSERTALVRHASRLFVVGASLTVPFFTLILRKGYGLGAQAMAGGSFKAPFFTVSWPTGEFGGMGLEGAVKLGYRKELEAETDPEKRQALYQEMVDRMYEHGKAVNMASHLEIDEVIDPADSRHWILRALKSAPPTPPRTGKKRPCVDTW